MSLKDSMIRGLAVYGLINKANKNARLAIGSGPAIQSD